MIREALFYEQKEGDKVVSTVPHILPDSSGEKRHLSGQVTGRGDYLRKTTG